MIHICECFKMWPQLSAKDEEEDGDDEDNG